MLFAIKSSLKFPALATPNEVDCVMKDWWRMMSLQEHLKASYVYFAFLMTALLRQLQFVFCQGKIFTTTEKKITWTRRISWFLTWWHDPFRNPDPFLYWLAVAEAGTLKLDLRALKCQNPIFFLEHRFTHCRATITIKSCWPYRHFKVMNPEWSTVISITHWPSWIIGINN